MKKKLKILMTVSAVAVLFALSGCEIPDYQLEFSIDGYTDHGSYVTVYYTIENIGWKDMDNVQIRITVESSIGTFNQWTPSGVELSVDNSISGSMNISYSGILNSVQVTAAGWDEG